MLLPGRSYFKGLVHGMQCKPFQSTGAARSTEALPVHESAMPPLALVTPAGTNLLVQRCWSLVISFKRVFVQLADRWLKAVTCG